MYHFDIRLLNDFILISYSIYPISPHFTELVYVAASFYFTTLPPFFSSLPPPFTQARRFIYKTAVRSQLHFYTRSSIFPWLRILCFVNRQSLRSEDHSFSKEYSIFLAQVWDLIIYLLAQCLIFLVQLVRLKVERINLSWTALIWTYHLRDVVSHYLYIKFDCTWLLRISRTFGGIFVGFEEGFKDGDGIILEISCDEFEEEAHYALFIKIIIIILRLARNFIILYNPNQKII